MPKKSKRNWIDVSSHIRELEEETWRHYFVEMPGKESITFLADPKGELLRDGLIKGNYTVETHIVNADVKIDLAAAAIPPTCCSLFVFHDEKRALLVVYRHPGKRTRGPRGRSKK